MLTVFSIANQSSINEYSSACSLSFHWPRQHVQLQIRYNFSTISAEDTLTEIIAERARFLTRPQLEPSGVSAGQILPNE